MSADDNLASPSRLFRAEALAGSQLRYGSPVRPFGIGGWVLTGFLVTLLLVVVLFLSLANYARKETVRGAIQPADGAVRITSLSPGIVEAVHVKEGQAVRRGQYIATLTLDRTNMAGQRMGTATLAFSEQEMAALSARSVANLDLVAREREELAAKVAELNVRREQIGRSLALQEERLAIAEESVRAAEVLHGKGYFPASQLRDRQSLLIAAQQARADLEREARSVPAQLAQLRAQDARLMAQAAATRADAAAASAQLGGRRVATEGERGGVLIAPRDGTVSLLQAKVGASIAPATTLAVIIPRERGLLAELWVPSRGAGFVRPGDKVRLMYDAFPYQQFGVAWGEVVDVAGAALAPQEAPVPLPDNEAVYRVRVMPEHGSVDAYGKRWSLSPGMGVTADLVLENRTFLQWLLDPVLALRGKAFDRR